MPFGILTRVGPMNHALDWGQERVLQMGSRSHAWRGNFDGEKRPAQDMSAIAPGTRYRLTLDLVTLYAPLKNTSKHTCLDSLNLKPPAPPYPLQDFKALYKYCIIIIIIIKRLSRGSTGTVRMTIRVYVGATWWCGLMSKYFDYLFKTFHCQGL